MQIYLINLDKDTDRLAAADAQLKGYGISYTRESACYAKELPEAERMKHVNQFRWWCVVGRKIEMGEIGCAVSHYRIMQRMVEQNILCACILEDDVEIHYNFKETIDKVEKWITTSLPQVVLLSNHCDEPENVDQIMSVNRGACSEAYVLTITAAKALLKANYPICSQCDRWERWSRLGIIQLYLSTPSPCYQNFEGFESNMEGGFKFVRDMNILEKMLHKSKRAIGITLDRMLCTMGR